TYNDNTIGASGYEQYWIKDSSFIFRYTSDVFAYAIYTQNTSKLHFMDVNNNLIGSVNNANKYSVRGNEIHDTYLFNDEITVSTDMLSEYYGYDYEYVITGYEFVGFTVSYSLLSGAFSTTPTSIYLDSYWNVGANINSGFIANDEDINNISYSQTWKVGSTFYYRYVQDIYLYPIYEAKDFTIEYYTCPNNYYGNPNHVETYYKLDESLATFNENHTVRTASLIKGYKLVGWYVTNALITNAYTIPSDISFWMNHWATSYETTGLVDGENFHTIQSDEVLGAGYESYEQIWSSGENGDDPTTFVWREAQTVYAYAYYIPLDYTVEFYNASNNLVGVVNNASTYYKLSTLTLSFNDVLWVKDLGNGKFDFIDNKEFYGTTQSNQINKLVGYTFQGWFVTNTPLTGSISDFTSKYESGDESFAAATNGDKHYYLQSWQVDSYKESHDTSYGDYFYFRNYEFDKLYAYAYYSTNENNLANYNINYYWTNNNSVYVNNGTHHTIGTEFANSVEYYTVTNLQTEKAPVSFNEYYATKVVSLNGYTFKGWYITKTTDGNKLVAGDYITGITSEFLYNKVHEDSDPVLDSGDLYKQDWYNGASFIFRYTYDVNAYAYYTPNQYKVHFYYSQYQTEKSTQQLDEYANNGNYSLYEDYNVNNNYKDFVTLTIIFNQPLSLAYAEFNLNNLDSSYVPYGYDFYYWIFSKHASTESTAYSMSIYDNQSKGYYNLADNFNFKNTTIANNGTIYYIDPTGLGNNLSVQTPDDKTQYVSGRFATANNYIFECYYDEFNSSLQNNIVVNFWDLYDQEEYYFYAYYKKEMYNYTYHYSQTDYVDEMNDSRTYDTSDVNYVKYDNSIKFDNLPKTALPYAQYLYGWYVSDKQLSTTFVPNYDADATILSFSYMEGGVERTLELSSIYNEEDIYGYYTKSTSKYSPEQINCRKYIYAIYAYVVNSYDVDLKSSLYASSVDEYVDSLNNTLRGYVEYITYQGVNIYGEPTTNPVKVVDGTIYGRDYYLPQGSIYSLQNNTLELVIKCHQGYVLDKYSILSSTGANLAGRVAKVYDAKGSNGSTGTKTTNVIVYDEHENDDKSMTYTIIINTAYAYDTDNYSVDAQSKAIDITNILLEFGTRTYGFVNYSQIGSTNSAAEGYSYFPYVTETDRFEYTSSDDTYDIVRKYANDTCYFGNTNLVIFYPKHDRINGTSIYEISSY
ncbi:MAG: hypothetical protein IJX17_08595, partial [Clostridia bacterium]|nr:hypothetical protein [Clostridia bacterium]